MRVIDNYDLFEMYEQERWRVLKRLPVCSMCDEPITDEYCYKLDGDLICEACLDECRVEVEQEIRYE